MKRHPLLLFLALAVLLHTVCTSESLAQDAEKTFNQGLVKEEGEGSLQEAIDLYSRVADDPSAERSIRARALLHVGICYEKLGETNAEAAYRKLIKDFSDQKDVATIGRRKLANLESEKQVSTNAGIIVKEIASGEDFYAISPCGRYLTYIDWNAIELKVMDLKTGESWFITDSGTWEPPMQFPDNSVWSPDGQEIAYCWYRGDSTEIHIANLEGSTDRLLVRGINIPWPVGWSEDGQYLLAIKSAREDCEPCDQEGEMVLISTRDGSVSVVPTEEILFIACHMSLSPDGRFIAADIKQDPEGENTDIVITAVDGSLEMPAVSNTANDRNVIWSPDGKKILFLSNYLGSTDLWALNVENGMPRGEPEVLKTNLGKRTYLLGFASDSKLYYASTSERSDVYHARLDFTTGEILSKPVRLSENDDKRHLKAIWSPDGNDLAYVNWHHEYDDRYGRRYAFTFYDIQTGTERKIWTDLYGMPDNFWSQPVWSPDGKSMLVNGGTKDLLRGLYLVDIQDGNAKPLHVMKVKPGEVQIGMIFPTFSPDGKEVYYLSRDKKSILKLDIEKNKETEVFTSDDEILRYNLSPDGQQIAIKFWFAKKNELYVIPARGGNPRKVAEFESNRRPYVISWTKDNQHVILDLQDYPDQEKNALYMVPVNGGEPRMIIRNRDIFANGFIRRAHIHPDGQQVLFVLDTGYGAEIWALENIFDEQP